MKTQSYEMQIDGSIQWHLGVHGRSFWRCFVPLSNSYFFPFFGFSLCQQSSFAIAMKLPFTSHPLFLPTRHLSRDNTVKWGCWISEREALVKVTTVEVHSSCFIEDIGNRQALNKPPQCERNLTDTRRFRWCWNGIAFNYTPQVQLLHRNGQEPSEGT